MSHILHFYHLAALDYVDCVTAGSLNRPWLCPTYDASYFRFDAGTTGYLIGQYLKALNARRAAQELAAIWCGRLPHASYFTPGGVSSKITQEKIDKSRVILDHKLKPFIGAPTDYANTIMNTYFFDVVAVAHTYPEYFWIGNAHERFLSYGCFEKGRTSPYTIPSSPAKTTYRYIARGRRHSACQGDAGDVTHPGGYTWRDVNPWKIHEAVHRSWYDYNPATPHFRHPLDGQTTYNLNKAGAYTFVKAPRYKDETAGRLAYEVGPLARMVVNGDYYAGILNDLGYTGTPQCDDTYDMYSGGPTSTPEGMDLTGIKYRGDSTLDRHAARVLECYLVAHKMQVWLNRLEALMPCDPCTGPTRKEDMRNSGWGMTEAPRGALAHWMKVNKNNGKITKYQAVVPTTWNASPVFGGIHGAAEQSCIGLHLKDSNQPVELLRVLHSYDFCYACAIHLVTPNGDVKKFMLDPTP